MEYKNLIINFKFQFANNNNNLNIKHQIYSLIIDGYNNYKSISNEQHDEINNNINNKYHYK